MRQFDVPVGMTMTYDILDGDLSRGRKECMHTLGACMYHSVYICLSALFIE